jgi:hypothetical protein
VRKAWLFLYLFAVTVASSQPRKTAPPAAATSPASRICDDPFQVREPADGWPEAPVRVLFHHEKSKAPWSANPAIRIPGLEAAASASAHTLVCVEESRLEMGQYESGEPGYAPAWDVTLVRLPDRKVYFLRTGFYGEMPPYIKYNRGAGVGKPPTEIFVRWLRLVADQKVARLKLRLKSSEYHPVCAMAFSGDGTRLAVAQEPRSSGSGGTPPSPITVFDLATGTQVAAVHADYSTRSIALSMSGKIIATERYGHVEIWDAASGKVTLKPETTGVVSLLFGPADALGVGGGEKVQLWDITANRVLQSAPGSQVQLSPDGAWMAAKNSSAGFTLHALESGQELATFPRVSDQDKYQVSRDGRAMARTSLFGATMYISGSPQGHSVTPPNLGVSGASALAATRDGFVIANNDGVVGLVTSTVPEPRAFATDLSAIKAIAVSRDNKFIALGDSSGSVEIWELR